MNKIGNPSAYPGRERCRESDFPRKDILRDGRGCRWEASGCHVIWEKEFPRLRRCGTLGDPPINRGYFLINPGPTSRGNFP